MCVFHVFISIYIRIFVPRLLIGGDTTSRITYVSSCQGYSLAVIQPVASFRAYIYILVFRQISIFLYSDRQPPHLSYIYTSIHVYIGKGYSLAVIQSVASFSLAAATAPQYYQIPTLVPTRFGKNAGVCVCVCVCE